MPPSRRSEGVKDALVSRVPTLEANGDAFSIYWGGADSCMAPATCCNRSMPLWLNANSSPREGIALECGLAIEREEPRYFSLAFHDANAYEGREGWSYAAPVE
jgi:hypothetical protein